eukprot:CAMPEP_0172086782 /NCGR_PEP_ID=MMETSP1043-20130122/22319_1 /TAXON_ID=464988 /ORGANISM="Hemiselmis andersenii, Strain CCMP441" /LENGTH=104 /DNA_ID=CAMNT_0012748913 /DNA_START=95 /DNA_END=404 /DNA_ORIENTATION=+
MLMLWARTSMVLRLGVDDDMLQHVNATHGAKRAEHGREVALHCQQPGTVELPVLPDVPVEDMDLFYMLVLLILAPQRRSNGRERMPVGNFLVLHPDHRPCTGPP